MEKHYKRAGCDKRSLIDEMDIAFSNNFYFCMHTAGSYSLRYRRNDSIVGWKLIHPYGENVDTS